MLFCCVLVCICSSIECLLKLYVTGQLKTHTWSIQNCDLANSKSYLANARLYLATFKQLLGPSKIVTWQIQNSCLANSEFLPGQFKTDTWSYLANAKLNFAKCKTPTWPNSKLWLIRTPTWSIQRLILGQCQIILGYFITPTWSILENETPGQVLSIEYCFIKTFETHIATLPYEWVTTSL